MRSKDEIYALYKQRKDRLDPVHKAAMEVRAAYYGEIMLPLPEMDRNEKPLVANFVFSAGEQKAMRVASTMPDLYYPSTRPGITVRDTRARQRRLVNLAWWDLDRMKLKMRKRARHMIYYAASPVMLVPNFDEERPTWKVRNPLTALAPEMDTGEIVPDDIIFTYAKSFAWFQRHYPNQAREFGLTDQNQDGTITIIEYQDAEHMVLLGSGEKVEPPHGPYGREPVTTTVTVELERSVNRVGRCTAVLAGGIGLDYARGSFDGSIGMWQAMGKMMALEAIGMQRAIWPEEWLIDSPSGEKAEIVVHADPIRGITGHISGGDLKTIQPLPAALGNNMIDRLERYQRIESGIPAELGGESTSNIRTGKRGDQILSSVLDFPLQECQEILAVALQEENKCAIAIDKAYFPHSKSVYVSATAGEIDYDATDLWERDTHFVRYSHAGVDAQGIVVELGQLVGTGLISKRSAMETHPLIEDAEAEFGRITQERIRDGLLTGLSQMAADPAMAPVVAEMAVKLNESEIEVEDAVIYVNKAIQAQQAAQQQAAAEQAGPPGLPPGAGPEAQPGMAQPQAIGEAPQSLQNLTGLLNNLRSGSQAGVPSQAQAVA